MLKPRGYQNTGISNIEIAWGLGLKNVLEVLPTGAGKTVLVSEVIKRRKVPTIAIAHRQELVGQISMALALNGIHHRVVSPSSVRRGIERLHLQELGRRYIDQSSMVGVAGVDTLLRMKPNDPSFHWLQAIKLWVMDEAHHVLRDNKWGSALKMLPLDCLGLGVTATPRRADGCGLGRHADGVFDFLDVGPTMRDLIEWGFLTDYRVVWAPTDIKYDDIPIGPSGELNLAKLREAVHGSKRITGDVVGEYLRRAKGKLGVTFAVDIEHATELAAAYRAAGVPAEVVSSKTPDLLRARILGDFKNRRLLQLVNVDLFGEGFDLPAIEVVSMVRRTESLSLYMQQFGRALRLMVDPNLTPLWDGMPPSQRREAIASSGKPKALIIDHVGNVQRHFLPDAARVWSLDKVDKRSRKKLDDAVPVRVCANPDVDGTGIPCGNTYPRVNKFCPYCGWAPVIERRELPEHVDGDLVELSEEALAKLRGAVALVDGAARIPYGAPAAVAESIKRKHSEKQHAQQELRDTMAKWGGWQSHLGRDVSEQQKRFYFAFGVDVLSAMSLPRVGAVELRKRIEEHMFIDLKSNSV